MDPLIYKIIHLAGVMALFTAMGSMISTTCDHAKKFSGILHGISLILILVSGFGMIAKYSYGFPGWIIAKAVIWLALGGFLVVAKRKLISPAASIGVILVAGALAAYLGVMKPF